MIACTLALLFLLATPIPEAPTPSDIGRHVVLNSGTALYPDARAQGGDELSVQASFEIVDVKPGWLKLKPIKGCYEPQFEGYALTLWAKSSSVASVLVAKTSRRSKDGSGYQLSPGISVQRVTKSRLWKAHLPESRGWGMDGFFTLPLVGEPKIGRTYRPAFEGDIEPGNVELVPASLRIAGARIKGASGYGWKKAGPKRYMRRDACSVLTVRARAVREGSLAVEMRSKPAFKVAAGEAIYWIDGTKVGVATSDVYVERPSKTKKVLVHMPCWKRAGLWLCGRLGRVQGRMKDPR